jgi:hypothetical protein
MPALRYVDRGERVDPIDRRSGLCDRPWLSALAATCANANSRAIVPWELLLLCGFFK